MLVVQEEDTLEIESLLFRLLLRLLLLLLLEHWLQALGATTGVAAEEDALIATVDVDVATEEQVAPLVPPAPPMTSGSSLELA